MLKNLAFGIFFGLALMMLLHNLFHYLMLKELDTFYVFHVAFYIMFSGVFYGFGYLFSFENLPWLNNEGHLIFSCLAPSFKPFCIRVPSSKRE